MHRLRFLALIALLLTTLAAPSQRVAAQTAELTCDDFTNQEAAQLVFDTDEDEFAALDEEGDGEVCPDLPAAADDDEGDDRTDDPAPASAFILGTERADIEADLGDPAEDTDEDEWETGVVYTGAGDIDTIGIVYIDDLAAHIILTLDEEIADEEAALDTAADYLPTDADLATASDTLDDEAIRYEGTSDDLADLFPNEADYDDLGGEPGDMRVILVPGDEGTAVIDIAIGLGDEYEGGGTSNGDDDETPTAEPDEPDADADAYLDAVRDDLDDLQDQIDTFDELFVSATANPSDADIDTLIDILVEWSTATTRSDAVTAPDGYEDIQTAFEDLTETLEAIAAEIANGEDADFDAVVTDFADAQDHATDLDDLLTDEGS